MLSIFLTAVMLLTLVSCNKEYKKSENSSVSTVNELNQGDYQAVINKHKDDQNLSPRERYYLASAYSQSGGVDVFSLYSVMEIQLFHKNALEWSDLSKEKNPYLKFMKSQEGVDYEKKQKKKEEKWAKYEPKLIKKYNLSDDVSYEAVLRGRPQTGRVEPQTGEGDGEVIENDEVSKKESNYTREQYDEDHGLIRSEFERILKDELELSTDSKIELLSKFANKIFSEVKDPEATDRRNGIWYIESYYADRIFLNEIKERYLHPDQSNMLSNVQWEMLYMNILWNTYEAIPVMKKLPTLSAEQQADLSRSLEHYAKLLKTKEFREVAIKNILVLSSVSLLSIYKESFDLNDVESIQDLYCSFEPHPVINNYELIRERITFLQQAYLDSGIEFEEYKKYEATIEEMKKSIPPTLSPEERDRFVERVDEFKVNSCFNG